MIRDGQECASLSSLSLLVMILSVTKHPCCCKCVSSPLSSTSVVQELVLPPIKAPYDKFDYSVSQQVWVLGVLLFSGRWRRVPHRFTVCLIFSQVSSSYLVGGVGATPIAANPSGFPQFYPIFTLNPQLNYHCCFHFLPLLLKI